VKANIKLICFGGEHTVPFNDKQTTMLTEEQRKDLAAGKSIRIKVKKRKPKPKPKMTTLEVHYVKVSLYHIPADWDVKDVMIRYGNMFYKGDWYEGIKRIEGEIDLKYPETIKEDKRLNYMFEDENAFYLRD
jgi:hypothetical protein